MNKLVSLGIGIAVGAVVSAALVVFYTPMSGEALVATIKRSYDETLEEAREAAAERRAQLQAELARRRSRA